MLSQPEVITVIRDAILTTIACSAPMLAVAIGIGLIVSIFQATTQINEQTISFVPKLLGILFTILIFGGWILGKMSDFTLRLYDAILLYIG